MNIPFSGKTYQKVFPDATYDKKQTCVCSAKKSASFFSGSAGAPAAEESIHSCSEEKKSIDEVLLAAAFTAQTLIITGDKLLSRSTAVISRTHVRFWYSDIWGGRDTFSWIWNIFRELLLSFWNILRLEETSSFFIWFSRSKPEIISNLISPHPTVSQVREVRTFM